MNVIIYSIKFFFIGSDLFIVRLTESGLADSRPCIDCLETLKRFKVRRVYYSTRNEGIKMEKVKDMDGYIRPYKSSTHYNNIVLNPSPP